MNKTLLILAFFFLPVGIINAQSKEPLLTNATTGVSAAATQSGLSLTFTSETEVKFFIYVNGQLQNKKSTGRLTINGLEDKPYHIRIVMDDPFEIVTTRTMRPSKTASEYSVCFNPIRERIYVTRSHESANDNDEYYAGAASTGSRTYSKTANTTTAKKTKHLSRKKQAEAASQQGTTGKEVKTAKQPYLEEE